MDKSELTRIIESSHLNFLLGAGASCPFLPVLGNIEKELNEAASKESKEEIYKKYFTIIILPNKKLVEPESSNFEDGLKKTLQAYEKFFSVLQTILLRRKNTLLSKQANIFTTNIDMLQELALEKIGIEYSDGFSGKIQPIFRIENFRRITQQKSLHFDYVSEIPVFNIIKTHGSLTWKYKNDLQQEIILSPCLEHINEHAKAKTGNDFIEEYQKILIVNPEEDKHLETVLNFYYSELLRLYSSILEKENSVLFVIGFSMTDQHIREITLRAARSNPTLQIYIFCYKKNEKENIGIKIKIDEYPNIQIVTSDTKELTLSYITENYFKNIWETN